MYQIISSQIQKNLNLKIKFAGNINANFNRCRNASSVEIFK